MERFTRDPPALNLQVTHERIMTDPSGSGSALALIGQVARILNSGLAADETLRVVVATLKAGLQARSVVIWRLETHGAGFAGITVPTGEHAAFSLDDLPAAESGTRRYALVHGGGRRGRVRRDRGADRRPRGLLARRPPDRRGRRPAVPAGARRGPARGAGG